MSCARENEVLQLETEWLAAAEQASIRAHLSECSSCSKTAELVLGSRAELRRTRTTAELSPSERRSIVRSFAKDEKPRTIMRWSLAALAVAASALIAIALLKPDRGPTTASPALRDDLFARGQRVLVPEHARLRLAGAEVEALSSALIELTSLAPDRDLLHLSDGALAVELGDRDILTVLTPTLRVEGVGAAFRLDVDAAKTSVVVERGTVEVTSLDGAGETRVVAPSESMIVAREIASPATVEPTPQRMRREPRKPEPEKQLEPPVELDEPEPPAIVEPAKEDFEERIRRADAERRAGRLREALELYTEVANDPRGGAFAEEAMLRRATLLENLGSAGEALAVLREVRERFPSGELGPERVLLEVKIHLEQREPAHAATSLEQLDDRQTLQILRARIDTARAIAESQPNRALALLGPALARDVSEVIRRSALELEAEIRSREKK